jgi:hypothetical protein
VRALNAIRQSRRPQHRNAFSAGIAHAVVGDAVGVYRFERARQRLTGGVVVPVINTGVSKFGSMCRSSSGQVSTSKLSRTRKKCAPNPVGFTVLDCQSIFLDCVTVNEQIAGRSLLA